MAFYLQIYVKKVQFPQWALRKLLGKGGGGHFLEELSLSENSFSVASFECKVLYVRSSNLWDHTSKNAWGFLEKHQNTRGVLEMGIPKSP